MSMRMENSVLLDHHTSTILAMSIHMYVKFSVLTRNKSYDTFQLEYINIVLFFFLHSHIPRILTPVACSAGSSGQGEVCAAEPAASVAIEFSGHNNSNKNHTPHSTHMQSQRAKAESRTHQHEKQTETFVRVSLYACLSLSHSDAALRALPGHCSSLIGREGLRDAAAGELV